MKFLARQSYFITLALLILLAGCRHPEPQKPDPVRRKSPIAIASVTHAPTGTYIKIVYGQPYKKERKVFGSLVSYDQVWRTGANEATEITTTQEIRFGKKKLPAGTYSLFSIPHEDNKWTIILNNELGQWGAFEYNEAADFLRVEVPSRKKESVTEAFTIEFSEIAGDSTSVVMQWDQTVVKIPVEFIEEPTARS